ncbi:MAG TPA: hypothetical protein VGC88_07465 [Terriglobales bacterium]
MNHLLATFAAFNAILFERRWTFLSIAGPTAIATLLLRQAQYPVARIWLLDRRPYAFFLMTAITLLIAMLNSYAFAALAIVAQRRCTAVDALREVLRKFTSISALGLALTVIFFGSTICLLTPLAVVNAMHYFGATAVFLLSTAQLLASGMTLPSMVFLVKEEIGVMEALARGVKAGFRLVPMLLVLVFTFEWLPIGTRRELLWWAQQTLSASDGVSDLLSAFAWVSNAMILVVQSAGLVALVVAVLGIRSSSTEMASPLAGADA